MRPNGLSTRESLKSRKVEERCDEGVVCACATCVPVPVMSVRCALLCL